MWQIEDTGLFPVDTYWIGEEWLNYLRDPRSQLVTIVDWETATPLGCMVYKQHGELSVIVKMTVNDVIPSVIFTELVNEFLDKCHTPRTHKFMCRVHTKDVHWRIGFELSGFLINGSIEENGESYDYLVKFK